MTNEEAQYQIESIFQILAQTTKRLDDLASSLKQVEQNQRADAIRITRLEENMLTLTTTVSTLVEVVRNQDERIDGLSERMERLDARVDRLVTTIERYITARGANGQEGDDGRA